MIDATDLCRARAAAELRYAFASDALRTSFGENLPEAWRWVEAWKTRTLLKALAINAERDFEMWPLVEVAS